MALVSVSEFRSYAGAGVATVPDSLVQGCLDEAEAGLLADLGIDITVIYDFPEPEEPIALARGEELRRASRLLARRNSPESISGQGEAVFTVPSRDPDSARTIWALKSALTLHEGIA